MTIPNRLVIKIGGSVLFPNDVSAEFFEARIRELAEGLNGIKKSFPNTKIVIIIGGGFWAKSYIKFAEELNISQITRDIYGITISRMNADITRRVLSDYVHIKISPEIPPTPEEASRLIHQYDIILMGGTYPGQSTIGTASLVAEAINADLFIIITDVKGVYKADPKSDPKAEKYDQISIKELKNLIIEHEAKPGTYKLMDIVAAKMLERSKIPTLIIGCKKLSCIKEVVENYVKGEFKEITKYGTIIVY